MGLQYGRKQYRVKSSHQAKDNENQAGQQVAGN